MPAPPGVQAKIKNNRRKRQNSQKSFATGNSLLGQPSLSNRRRLDTARSCRRPTGDTKFPIAHETSSQFARRVARDLENLPMLSLGDAAAQPDVNLCTTRDATNSGSDDVVDPGNTMTERSKSRRRST